jgi:hypothetical protein
MEKGAYGVIVVTAANLGLWLVSGLLLGLGYFYLVSRTADLYARDGSRLDIAFLYAARVAAALATFWAAVQFGAVALLGAFIGFLAGRFVLQLARGHW